MSGFDVDSDEAERNHWNDVMRTFLHYENFVEIDLERRQNHLNRLPKALADKLPDISYEKLSALHNASKINQTYFREMVYWHARNTVFDEKGNSVLPKKEGTRIHPNQQHRNLAVLHSLYREWSSEGAAERAIPFNALIDELKAHLPVTKENAYKQRVLVPGCGIGRLPVEIASHGYATEGNEFSAFMAIASNFVLNGLYEAKCLDVCPWLENVCNIINVRDSFASVSIPDIPAIDILDSFNVKYPHLVVEVEGEVGNTSTSNTTEGEKKEVLYPRFSMSTGDFCEIYGGDKRMHGAWDCVVTCFFIDTAPVVLEYIDTIHRILKPGGVWINLGPLLYHWVSDAESNNDPRYEQSLELSYEELKHVIQTYGFEYVTEKFQECTYTRNNSSMMWNVYNTVLFTVRKPLEGQQGGAVTSGGGAMCGVCTTEN